MARGTATNTRNTKRNGRSAGGNDRGASGDVENVTIITDSGAGDGGGGSDGSVINPASIAGSGGDSGSDSGPDDVAVRPKRPYRRRTGKNSAGAAALDLTNLNKVLLVSHSLLARLTGAPEFELDTEEAKSLAGAAGEVMSHYNVSFLDDKTTAWINLAQVAFGVYGVRFAAARARKAAERQEAAERRQAEAAKINPSPTAPAFQNTSVHSGLEQVQ